MCKGGTHPFPVKGKNMIIRYDSGTCGAAESVGVFPDPVEQTFVYCYTVFF